MISTLYAGILALIIVWLALNVIKLRRANKVPLGDGNLNDLQGAIRAHGNATEYIPISLLLLVVLEFSGGYPWLIHLAGLVLVAGRIIHAKGLLVANLKYRILGMHLIFYSIVILAIANIAIGLYKITQ